jgi:hypothetical protein
MAKLKIEAKFTAPKLETDFMKSVEAERKLVKKYFAALQKNIGLDKISAIKAKLEKATDKRAALGRKILEAKGKGHDG